jgi:hypothetical protein
MATLPAGPWDTPRQAGASRHSGKSTGHVEQRHGITPPSSIADLG